MQLTPAQEKQILEFWNRTPDEPPALKDITKEVFGAEFDGRSEQGRAIKAALAKFNLRAKAASDYTPKTGEIQLTDEQKLFITNNAVAMSALEMARTLFQNEAITNLHAETRVVLEFVRTLDTTVVSGANENVPTEDYDPPNTLDQTLKRVNRYVNMTLTKDKLTAVQKKGLDMLTGYLHNNRFKRQMNTFDSIVDRDTCEDAFIRYTYDKPDLTQEEIDQYIELANQVVQGFKVLRRSEQLQRRLEETTNHANTDAKLSLSWVEAIGKASTEYHQCIQRQQKLLDDLKEKRSTRLSKQMKENASILNLVQEWRNYEMRQDMIKIGEREQAAVAKEVEKLTTLSDIKARILGLTKDGILHG